MTETLTQPLTPLIDDGNATISRPG